jgi:hypothetical protein
MVSLRVRPSASFAVAVRFFGSMAVIVALTSTSDATAPPESPFSSMRVVLAGTPADTGKDTTARATRAEYRIFCMFTPCCEND